MMAAPKRRCNGGAITPRDLLPLSLEGVMELKERLLALDDPAAGYADGSGPSI